MNRKETLIQKDSLLHHIVRLPIPGKVSVHLGQEVETGDLIAEANLPARFQVFDVLNHFRIKESKLENCIKRLSQEEVQRGDVIARKPGLISRLFRAPEDGKIVAVRDGRVTLAMGERSVKAYTPINGVIAQLLPGLGAEIVTRGKSLRGAWGNGQIDSGKLVIIEKIDEDTLDDLTDCIVFLDDTVTYRDLELLHKAKVAGLIVPALNPLNYDRFSLCPFPLMSLAGFGETKTDPLLLDQLSEFNGQEVYLLARRAEPDQAVQPEVFLPGIDSKNEELFVETKACGLGSIVRLIGMPYFGSIGKIVELPEQEERLASGVSSRIAVVERNDGTLIRVPIDNFEVLEA